MKQLSPHGPKLLCFPLAIVLWAISITARADDCRIDDRYPRPLEERRQDEEALRAAATREASAKPRHIGLDTLVDRPTPAQRTAVARVASPADDARRGPSSADARRTPTPQEAAAIQKVIDAALERKGHPVKPFRDLTTRSPLANAITAGDAALVDRLIASGAKVNEGATDYLGRPLPLLVHASREWRFRLHARGAQRETQTNAAFARIVHRLLEAGADPGAEYDGQSALRMLPLEDAGRSPAPSTIKAMSELIAAGALRDISPGELSTLLAGAAREWHPEPVRILIRAAHPAAPALDRALRVAFEYGRWTAAIALLDAGANPNAPAQGSGFPGPLLAAIGYTDAPRALLLALITHGADANVHVPGGWTPLIMAMHDHELMRALLDAGADPNMPDTRRGMTPLQYAVLEESFTGYAQPAGAAWANAATREKSVRLLLAHGARTDVSDSAHRTPLMVASPRDASTVAAMLDAGATVRTDGERKRPPERPSPNPVEWALDDRNEALAVQLLRRDASSRADCVLAYRAAADGFESVLHLLLDDPNLRSGRGLTHRWSALHAAAHAGHADVVRLLLERRAFETDVRTPRLAPMTPADIAQAEAYATAHGVVLTPARRAQIVREQEEARARSGGETPLMTAAKAGRVEVVRVLLANGADANARDNAGLSVVDYTNLGTRSAAAQILPLLSARTK